jgi:hypothetical protein
MGAQRALILALLVACADEEGGGGARPSAPVFDGGPGAPPPTWSARRSLPLPQQETAVLELGGKVYVLGGLTTDGRVLVDVNVYDPAVDTWTAARSLPEPLHHINAAIAGGRIWITGALRGGDFAATGAVLAYDPAADTWTARTPMREGTERGSAFTAAIGDFVYVAGGLRGGSVSDFARYDTLSGAWEDLPPLPAALDHGGAAAYGGIFYAFGGRSGAHTSRVSAFDPEAKRWSTRARMPTSRAGFALAVQEGRAILFGGEGNAASPIGMFDEVEAYDFVTDTWSILPPMSTPRHGMGAAFASGMILVPGGGTKQGLAATDVVESLGL